MIQTVTMTDKKYESLVAENERLRAALKPFAKYANSNRYARFRDCVPGAPVYIEDVERAAEALSQPNAVNK